MQRASSTRFSRPNAMDARTTVRVARHALVRLDASTWQTIAERNWDDEARACIAHWAQQDLPLVVTRQRAELSQNQVALGLPAPLQWSRRKIALDASRDALAAGGSWPDLAEIADALASTHLPALDIALQKIATNAVVYGGYGWQHLTRLTYVHGASDLDLLIHVRDDAHADEVLAVLESSDSIIRLDGELIWPTGEGIAWREWLAMRAGRSSQALYKRIDKIGLVTRAWLVRSTTL